MRLHRFFVAESINNTGINHLSDADLSHQLGKVFRLHAGDQAVFFDGSGDEHVSELVSLERKVVSFRVLETRSVKRFSETAVTVAMSLIKKDNFEWVIQKATELGAAGFVPLVSERSEKKGFNIERAKKIAVEASEQSGRGDVPKISEPVSFEAFLAAEARPIVAFHTEGAEFDPENFSSTKELVALIGPEGGWTEKEVALFKEKGAPVVRLNAPVLRAETAAVAISTLLLVR